MYYKNKRVITSSQKDLEGLTKEKNSNEFPWLNKISIDGGLQKTTKQQLLLELWAKNGLSEDLNPTETSGSIINIVVAK